MDCGSMYSLDTVVTFYNIVITAVICLFIIINLILLKGFEKFVLIVAVVLYLAILFFIQDFFLASTLIILVFIAASKIAKWKYLVKEEIIIAMGVIILLLDRANPVYILFSFAFYIIAVANFLYSTVDLMKSEGKTDAKTD